MIISASRRTDIPAFYAQWLKERIRAGYVLVRNPMFPSRISRVSLAKEDVDGIVFWTKNPIPMMPLLNSIPYPFYFQFTLNPYGPDIEPGVPSKSRSLIPALIEISESIGPGRIIWRYDPIILGGIYDIEYHIKYFERLASLISRYVRSCTFSFMDVYRNTLKNTSAFGVRAITNDEMHTLAVAFSEIGHAYGLKLNTCAESIDLDAYNIGHAKCVDASIFEEITGRTIRAVKDKNQRHECNCDASIDIGAYHCCPNGCAYCYANSSLNNALRNHALHAPDSPLIIGVPRPDDTITDRK